MTAILSAAASIGRRTFALADSASASYAWSSDAGSWRTTTFTVNRVDLTGIPPIALTAEIVSGAAGTTLEGTTTINNGDGSVSVNFRNAAANTGSARVKATDALGAIAYSKTISLI